MYATSYSINLRNFGYFFRQLRAAAVIAAATLERTHARIRAEVVPRQNRKLLDKRITTN